MHIQTTQLLILFLGLFYTLSTNAKDPVVQEKINNLTKPSGFESFSVTPVYKSKYKMTLYTLDYSCDSKEEPPAAQKIEFGKNVKFRESFDRDSQTTKEKIVDIYNVEKASAEDYKSNSGRFFSSPYKLCLSGQQAVPRSHYRRIGGINTGALVVPFKMREGDLYADTAIGPYISIKFEVIEFIATVGISQIAFSEIGTKDVETKTGLTSALGLNFEASKDIDLMFLIGSDHLSGKAGDEWEYQNKVWFSFGLGYNFTK